MPTSHSPFSIILTLTFQSRLFTKELFSAVNLKKWIGLFLHLIKILQLLFLVSYISTSTPYYSFSIQPWPSYWINGTLKTVKVTPRNSNPWFSPNLRTERHKRRQLECSWRNSRNEADRLLYKKPNINCIIPL